MADNNENKKDGGFNFPPVGGGKNIKAPKFNGYWMYIILAVIIIGFQFFKSKYYIIIFLKYLLQKNLNLKEST